MKRVRLVVVIFAFFAFAQARALCVKVQMATLRAGPSFRDAITWRAGLYTPLVELASQGGWFKVKDMDGDIQWIPMGDVSQNMECLSVRVQSAILRMGPSRKAKLANIVEVDRYTPFKQIDENGDWYKVEASWGSTYWINDNAVWLPLRIMRVSF